MRLKCKLQWNPVDYLALDVPKKYLLAKPDPRFLKALGTFLVRAREHHNEKVRGADPPRPQDVDHLEFEVVMEYDFRKRSLDLNALMWALYQAEADLMNASRYGPGAVTKAQLYRQDMLAYAPSFIVRIPQDGLPRLKKMVRPDRIKEVMDEGRDLMVTVMETSSQWDNGRMHLHVEMLFDRLAEQGAPINRDSDLKAAFLEWRKALNDQKIILHAEMMTEEEYRDRQQSCESCGKFVGDGTGHLAHISSRGSGATWGPFKKDPRDWLHLCAGCHVVEGDSQHTAGWSVFLEKAPHLRFKVQEALRREVHEPELPGIEPAKFPHVLVAYDDPEAPQSDVRYMTDAEADALNGDLEENAWVKITQEEVDAIKGKEVEG